MAASLLGRLASMAADVVLGALLGDLWVSNAVNIVAITSRWAGAEVSPMVSTARSFVESSERSAKLLLLLAFPLVVARVRRFAEPRLDGGHSVPERRRVVDNGARRRPGIVSAALNVLIWVGNCFLTFFLVWVGLLAPEEGSSQGKVVFVPSDMAGFCFSFFSCFLLVPDMLPRLF